MSAKDKEYTESKGRELEGLHHKFDRNVMVVQSERLFVAAGRTLPRTCQAVIWDRKNKSTTPVKEVLGNFWAQVAWPANGEPKVFKLNTDKKGHFYFSYPLHAPNLDFKAREMFIKMAHIHKKITGYQTLRVEVTDEPEVNGPRKVEVPTLLCCSFNPGIGWASSNPPKRNMVDAGDFMFAKRGFQYRHLPWDGQTVRMMIEIKPAAMG